MAFTTNLSGVTQLDNSLVQEFDSQFIIAAAQEAVADQFVSYKQEIGAKSIQLTKYSQLALATTALTETDDVTSEAMADSAITLTPVEYGNVVTRTALAALQSGGKADLAAARLVGINMGRTLDKLAILAGEGSSNSITPSGSAESALDATNDIATAAFLNKVYNKLARASVAPLADGMYVAVLHDDVIHDIRNSSGAGSWQDINKYSNAMQVLKNEVGMLCGFRIVRDNHCTITADVSTTVDSYRSLYLGFNALGKAVSKEPGMVATGPFDKLARFVNIGWHGVLKYGIVDQDALWLGITSSSVGSNA